mgnify:FL=1
MGAFYLFILIQSDKQCGEFTFAATDNGIEVSVVGKWDLNSLAGAFQYVADELADECAR